MLINRRQFLASGVAGLSSLSVFSRQQLKAAQSSVSERFFEVEAVERTTVRLPFRPVPRRNMDREIPHWRFIEVCDVKLKSGHTGTGETMLFYTFGVPSDAAVKRVIGKSAVDLMWDDSLGAGLQMAMFDAVGKTTGSPVHVLLGKQVHSQTALSWWNIDTSAADMASECAEAVRLGYMSYKTKGRPWFDIHEQLAASVKKVPTEFKIDMDFNDTLLTAKKGMQIIKDLEKYPQVDIYESPIPQSDVAGNKAIRDATRVNIAMHYGTPDPATVVRDGVCDGFVIGGGATRVTNSGRFAGEVDMPFWLQLVGAGMTAAYSLHFGGVLEQATWPAVNCHQLFEHDLLTEPIRVENGFAAVPDRPGIGYSINRDIVAKHKVERPTDRPEPKRLIETTWADGGRMYTASNGKVNFMLTAANEGKYPYYKKGAHTQAVPDDGSARWKELYERARKAGPIEA
jgi:L-alanine-DL-glutamate epimerase-like enolase superfamily enzyme